jgi:hypothetical protein
VAKRPILTMINWREKWVLDAAVGAGVSLRSLAGDCPWPSDQFLQVVRRHQYQDQLPLTVATSLIPCFRHRSAVFMPVSCSFRMAMICTCASLFWSFHQGPRRGQRPGAVDAFWLVAHDCSLLRANAGNSPQHHHPVRERSAKCVLRHAPRGTSSCTTALSGLRKNGLANEVVSIVGQKRAASAIHSLLRGCLVS